MERIERQSDIYHMKCDVCGKEEDIIDRYPFRSSGWCKRHWSKLTFEHTEPRINMFWISKHRPIEEQMVDRKIITHMHLCPECTKNFKKNIKVITVEQEAEVWR